MSLPVFLQILANVAFTTGLFVAFARLRRPAKDDPRMSKGLQLLSSKIAVLEDLSDRTESQVQQMLLLLDQKSKELQSKIALADQQVAAVRQSMAQSLEVATIFQDKIPHSEIIERQNSVKYIRAARLAHAGVSVADIAREVDLPLGEIEFIAKVNHENLSFREEELPAWAREPQLSSSLSHANRDASSQVTDTHLTGAYGAGATEAQLSAHSANMAAVAAQAALFDAPTPRPMMPVPPSAQELASPGHETRTASIPALSPEKEQLVDKLNKLHFEMKNLDLELAHRSQRNVMPDMTQAFDSPRLESSSLERLGEEFRRAVEEAERASREETNTGGPGLFDKMTPEKAEPMPSFASLFSAQFAKNETAKQVVPVTVPSAPPANGATPSQASSSGPALGAQASATLAREVSIPELEAARAAAAALRTKDADQPKSADKIIRRVEFPRI